MRFYLIDAFRGIGALWVVLHHLYKGHHIDSLISILPKPIVFIVFELGIIAVPFFFVMSGFVIAHSLNRDKIDGKYFAKFTLRRSIRLDPPYWASLIIILGIAWISSFIKMEKMLWPSVPSLLSHLVYLQSFFNHPQINIVAWTLCLEFQFYLSYCLIMIFIQFFQKYFRFTYLAAFIILAAVSLLWPLGILKKNLLPGLFLPDWNMFILGIFCYWAWKKRIPVFLFFIYAGIVFIGAFINNITFSYVSSIAAVFIWFGIRFKYIYSFNWKVIQFFGLISYSLYLTHNPISGACFYIFYKIFGNSIWIQLIAMFITLVICILFAFIFWFLLEKWSIHLSRKIKLHQAEA